MTKASGHFDLDIEEALALVSHRLRSTLAHELSSHGLVVEQWRALNALYRSNGLTMTKISEYALLTLPTTTRTIDDLIGKALAYRLQHPTDKRKILVHISDRGREVWEEIVAARTSTKNIFTIDQHNRLRAVLRDIEESL